MLTCRYKIHFNQCVNKKTETEKRRERNKKERKSWHWQKDLSLLLRLLKICILRLTR